MKTQALRCQFLTESGTRTNSSSVNVKKMKAGVLAKKMLLLLVIIILPIITVMNTEKIEYNYKIVSDDINEEIISLECYKTKIMNYQILFFGNIFYNQSFYSFNLVTWSDFPFSRTEKLHTNKNENSEFSYTRWIRLYKNLEKLNIEVSIINKHTHHSSEKNIKALKIR